VYFVRGVILVAALVALPRLRADDHDQPAPLKNSTVAGSSALSAKAVSQLGDVFAVTVLTAAGAPASKAKITLGLAGSRITVINGELPEHVASQTAWEADEAGRFHWPLQPDDFWVVITHRSGFAKIKCSILSLPETIRLTPWARVEGTFRVARKPQAQVAIIRHEVLIPRQEDGPMITFFDFHETDAKGRFVFERVIPGHAQFGRNLQYFPNGDWHEPTSCSGTTVEAISGKTTRIDFGNSGRPVIGQLRRASNSRQELSWKFALIQINLEELRARRDGPDFMGTIDRNGNFCIDDVPAGKYRLTAYFPKSDEERLANYRFTVPEINDKLSQRPVDLGVLTLEPTGKRLWGRAR
jgi:hypothetical protein